MKKISIALSVAALLMVGCSDNPKEDTSKVEKTQATQSSTTTKEPQNIYGADTATAPSYADKAPVGADIQENAPHVGVILETVDATGYTYIKVDEGGTIYWVAAPQTSVKVGDTVSYIEQMVMKDFSSKALDRNFDYLMFASAIVKSGEKHDHASHAGKPHPTTEAHDCDSHAGKPHPTTETNAVKPPHPTPNKAEVVAEKISIKKLKGGYTVEELYASKDKLKDKAVKLRAKVTKVSKGIMGKDWIHLQDGTGEGATSDIILTTKNSTVNVGDVVVAEAIYKTDVDLGYGYFFQVILEEGKFVN